MTVPATVFRAGGAQSGKWLHRQPGVHCRTQNHTSIGQGCANFWQINWPAEGCRRNFRVAAAAGAAELPETRVPAGKLLLLSALVVALGVANRLLLKIALVPMGSYAFAMSLMQCFGYVIVYNLFLLSRIRSGIVTKEMRDTPSVPFIFVGLLEGITNVAQTYLAIRLPGALLPLLSQSGVIWQLGLSAILLGRRYSFRQVTSAIIVVTGVVLAGVPAKGVPSGGAHLQDVLAYAFTFSFIALDVLLKEKIFSDARKRMGTALDIFVVNSRGSLYQAIFVFLSLPVLTNLKGLSFHEIPGYFLQGMQCLMGKVPAGTVGVDPTGAPFLPLLYIAVNLSFNISALYVLRLAGSVHTSLVMSSVLPLTVLAFSFPLPLLGQPAPLGPFFGLGFVVLMVGMWLFNTAPKKAQ
eukprot:jgi/Tetstr1/461063/TSEL_006210.t1